MTVGKMDSMPLNRTSISNQAAAAALPVVDIQQAVTLPDFDVVDPESDDESAVVDDQEGDAGDNDESDAVNTLSAEDYAIYLELCDMICHSGHRRRVLFP